MGTMFGYFSEPFAPSPEPGRSDHGSLHPSNDAVSTYFECITSCSIDDGECVTRCVEILREEA
ncbi:hypothetical protein [Vulcanococcus limneticus]|jgi:hypothetical protein|uniref:hypothetical protein n=1 Tax=Vulcanococcus limneticus TaxID=2170428 RepID=UPI00398BEA50